MANPLRNRVTSIRYTLGEIDYRASGFFYRFSGEDYLITSKHVIEHEHGVSPDLLRILLDFEIENERETRPVRLELFNEDGDEKWSTHSRNENVDIASVPLDIDLAQTPNSYFSSDDHVPQDTEITIGGSAVIIVGIPGVIGPGESNSPIIRSGLASSPFGEPFGGEPCFVIDANLHNGMSGSPVLLQVNAMYDETDGPVFSSEGFPTYLLGVHSGPVDRTNEFGLHRAWYPNLIWDILS